MSLSSLLSKCHDQSFQMGWWSDCPPSDHSSFRWYICTKLCLIHSEIDEARTLAQDDHLPHRSAFEVELADVVIRTLDLVGFMVRTFPLSASYPTASEYRRFAIDDDLLMALHRMTSAAMEHFRKGSHDKMLVELSNIANIIDTNQSGFDVDVYGAMLEKLAYNATRADHQLVNRQADGGKSF